MSHIETALREFQLSTLPPEAKQQFLDLIELNSQCREDIIKFSEEMLGMPLNDFQKKFLSRTTTPRSFWQMRFGEVVEDIGGFLFGRNIAFPSNQVGKTVMIAIKHIYFNYYKIGLDLDGSMIDKAYYASLNISPHSRQVKQCFAYVKEILNEQFIINDPTGAKRLNKLNPLLKGFLIGDNANLGELRFVNNAVMYSVPVGQDQAASLAGAQFGYISYDECAQSYHLENELGAKIMSRLIRYGVCLDLISTPEVDSPSHQYYFHIVQLGLKGQDGWWACGATLDDNKFIPEQQRERAKADLLKTNPIKYLQVVKGEFVSSGKRFFDHAEIENLWRMPGRIACIPHRKYLLISDWGMSDTGDESVHGVLDYTDYLLGGRIRLVAHEDMQGGSPAMQFALLRTLYEAYTWYDEDGVTAHPPKFLMDANALGGVVIKKMLERLHPKGFDIPKDDALLLLKGALAYQREFEHSKIDGALIEKNPNFGLVETYYIQKLADQLGMYKIPDDKIKQDYVMVLMMGISYLLQKHPVGSPQQRVAIDPLASYNLGVKGQKPLRDSQVRRLW